MNQCYFCKGNVVPKRVRHVHEWGDRVLIFEDVPAEVCQQCGEVYFAPQALKQMDELTIGNSQPSDHMTVPVYSMAA
jgi:YgiT-type zinc finger domain-containing protein